MEGVDEVSVRHWSAIHREANVQVQCMTWLFAYFDVSWVVSAMLGQGQRAVGKNFALRKSFRGGLGSRALPAKKKLSWYFHSTWNFFCKV